MTDQTAPDPLTDQLLDEIDACVNGPLGSATDFDHTTVAPLVAEVRRLHAELGEARANGIRYAAGLVTQAFHGEPFLIYPPDFADLLRDHADRLTAAAHPAPAAVVSSAAETPGSAS